MKNWIMAKSAAAKIALALAAVLVVAAIGTGIYFGVKPSATPVTNEVVSIGDDTTPTTDAPVVEDNKDTEETTEVAEPVTEDETIIVETEEEVRVKEGYDLVNGNFAEGIFGYEVYAMNEGDIYYDTTDAGFTIHISDTGTEDWHVQLKQNDVRLEQGRWYRLSLDAKSDINRVITCTMQHNGNIDNNWTPYAPQKKLALGNNWKNYSIIFQMNEATDNHSVFNLSMGTVDGRRITSNHAVSVNNIVLEQLPANFTDSLRSGNNLIANANFSYDDILWDASVVAPGQASTSFAGNQATFNITNPGTLDWHVQLKQTGIKVKKNTGYKVSFNVSSTAARTIKLGVMDTNYVNWYGGGDLSVGPETKTVTVKLFNTICDDANAILMISMGKIEGEATPASTIVLSNFVMVEDNSVTAQDAGNGGSFGPNPTTSLGNGWEVYDHECAHTNGSKVLADGSFAINIKNIGSEAWHAQLTNKSFNLEAGKTYKISFEGKSSVARNITYMMQHNGNNDNKWDTYTVSNTAALTTEWQLFEQTFTMSVNDKGAVYNFSLGKSHDDVPNVAHTIELKNIKFEEVVYNGPEKTENGYIVRATNDLTTDEYGSKWIVNLEPSEYGMEEAQHKTVVIKVKLKSEGAFDGLLGACYGEGWAWTDSSFNVTEGGETEVTLKVTDFMGALQIQINNMSADSVEIYDINISEDTEEPSEEDPSEETVVGTIEVNNHTGEFQIIPEAYGIESPVGKAIKVTATLKGDGLFKGAIAGNVPGAWAQSDEFVSEDGSESVWEYTLSSYVDFMKIDIWWAEATKIDIVDLKVEDATPSEETVVGTIEVNNHTGEFQIIPEAYGIESPVGKAIKVTATLKGDAMFKGTIAGNVPGAWAQGAEFVSEDGSESVWEYTLSSYVDFMKIDIWWAEATKIDIVDIKVEDVTPAADETPEEPEIPEEPTPLAPVVTADDVTIAADEAPLVDEYGKKWQLVFGGDDYADLVGKKVKFSADLQSDSYYGGKIIIQSHEDYSGWNESGQYEVDGSGAVSHWEVVADDFKQAFIQLYWRDEENPCAINVSEIKFEVIEEKEDEE